MYSIYINTTCVSLTTSPLQVVDITSLKGCLKNFATITFCTFYQFFVFLFFSIIIYTQPFSHKHEPSNHLYHLLEGCLFLFLTLHIFHFLTFLFFSIPYIHSLSLMINVLQVVDITYLKRGFFVFLFFALEHFLTFFILLYIITTQLSLTNTPLQDVDITWLRGCQF